MHSTNARRVTQNCVAPMLLVCSNVGRLHFLARASRSLPAGEVLVQVRDLVGRRRAMRTHPDSRGAVLVATEPPLILRGGLTALVSYYRVPMRELEATETHSEHGVETHRRHARLRIVSVARATGQPSAQAARTRQDEASG